MQAQHQLQQVSAEQEVVVGDISMAASDGLHERVQTPRSSRGERRWQAIIAPQVPRAPVRQAMPPTDEEGGQCEEEIALFDAIANAERTLAAL